MDNPITVSLPQDLPTNWTYGQTVAPTGAQAGLAEQYGYNYLMEQVNAAQQAASEVGEAFTGAASQTNLTSHINDKSNPHSVTAAQVGADPAGSAAAVQTNLTSHINDKSNPHSVTAAQVGADPAGSAAAVQTALTALLNEKAQMVSGSYAGTGTIGSANPNTITFPFAPKLVIFLGDSDDGTSWSPLFDVGYAIFVPMDFLSTDFRRQNPPWIGSTLYDKAYSKKSADGKTLSWYVNSATASGQLNVEGRTYWYAALG